jgi:predicted DCC family thiol-disulfide oxidoreductase YuxK
MHNPSPCQPIVIFDGDCGFCNFWVAFVLRHESGPELLFTPNASPFGRSLCELYAIQGEVSDSIVVVSQDGVLLRSDAVVFIARHLKPPARWLMAIRLVPRPLRDLGYRCVAFVRRSLPFAKNQCSLLPPDKQARIIEEGVV